MWPTVSEEKAIMEGHDEAKPLKNFARIQPAFFKPQLAIYAKGEFQTILGPQVQRLLAKLAEMLTAAGGGLNTPGRVAVYELLATVL